MPIIIFEVCSKREIMQIGVTLGYCTQAGNA